MKPCNALPINATAARVISRGEHFEYRAMASEVCSALPLPMKDNPPELEDFTGKKLGRLTVIGRFDGPKNRWVCRCSCGNFCIRLAKTLSKAPADSACVQCYLLAVSKRQEYLRRTGKERHTREFLA